MQYGEISDTKVISTSTYPIQLCLVEDENGDARGDLVDRMQEEDETREKPTKKR
jgi:hypothetical protein